MKKHIFLSFIAVLIISCLLYGFQKQEKLLPPEKHEVTVRLILVDVIATDKKGNFVTDLTKDDFLLFEDGLKVPINSVDLISLEKAEFIPPEKKEVPKPAFLSRKKRLIVIFDSINTIRKILEQSRPEIIEKLISLIKLGHEIMVLELTEKKGMQVLQPFTQDENLLAKAVKKASGSIWVEKSLWELWTGADIEDEAGSQQIQVKTRSKSGGETGSGQTQAITQDESLPGPAQVTRKKYVQDFTSYTYKYHLLKRFEKTINGLWAVTNIIKNFSGRKTVLLISGGIPNVGSTKTWDAHIKIFNPFKLLEKKGIQREEEFLKALIHFANAQNITFYALDPDTFVKYLADDILFSPFQKTGLALKGSEFEILSRMKKEEVHNLNLLAQSTGGVSLKGAKRFENFYQAVKRDLTYYYELSFYPKRKEADGKYHKIQVKVKRPGVKIRFRKGYSDYSENQKETLLVSSASYNPSLFKQIPFEARAIPFVQDKDKFILWMNLALPVRKFITENINEIISQNLKLHLWIKDPDEERAYAGQINIPLNLTPSFLEYIEYIKYLKYNLRTPELKLKTDKYKVVFALYDEKTGMIGTVEQTLVIPDLKNETKPRIVNIVLGNLDKDIEGVIKPLSISKKGGSLQLSKHKFYPSVMSEFTLGETIGVFLQLYTPQDEPDFKPQFSLFREEEKIAQLSGEIMDKSWDNRVNVWNGVFSLDISNFPPGDYMIKIELSGLFSEGKLEKNLPLKII